MMHRILLALALLCTHAAAADLRQVIEGIKPSVVGIGNFQKLRSPPVVFAGTGFAVGDGLTIITAAHVVQDMLKNEAEFTLGVLLPQGELAQFRPATITAFDQAHDLVRLHITGSPLPALAIGNSDQVAEGAALAFTGFPLGMALGLHPATHRCTLAAITPLASPAVNATRLDARLASQLGKTGYTVFQLDGTAYPGNSGSPLFDAETGEVIGVINMVYVKGLKEAAIATPSGISYAVPAKYLVDLLRR
jgi:S1-C subfamily serine protease